MAKPHTFYDKIWTDHLVDEQPDGTCLIYIDRHIVHEVTSPQAFEGLRLSGRKVHAPDKTLVVVDHNVPTSDRKLPNPDAESAAQIAYLAENAKLYYLRNLRGKSARIAEGAHHGGQTTDVDADGKE